MLNRFKFSARSLHLSPLAWLLALVLALIAVQSFARSDPRTDGNTTEERPTFKRTKSMPTISVADLPAEGRDTLKLIKQGGPFPYRKDGTTFGNREGRLPNRDRGYYREYTVPTPGAETRGARRIIAGAPSEYYYTDDHYRSFKRIVE